MKFLNFLKSLLFAAPKVEQEIRRAIIDLDPVAEAPVVKPKKKRVYKKKK
jgi:hypothetical protein